MVEWAPITREERVNARREQIFFHYDHKLQAFLDFVLFQYVKEGVGELDAAPIAVEIPGRQRCGGAARRRSANT